MSSAICSAIGRASVLIRRISAWTSARLPLEELIELGVRHHLGVFLEPVGNLLLLGRA